MDTLKKHVRSVVFVEDISSDDEVGYFVVNFDSEGHGGGTYVYPATKQQAKDFKAGKLKDEESTDGKHTVTLNKPWVELQAAFAAEMNRVGKWLVDKPRKV